MLYVSLRWRTPVKTICNDSLEGRHPDDPANGASVPHSRVTDQNSTNTTNTTTTLIKTQQPHVFINIRLRSCPHHCVWVFALTFFQLCFLLWPWSGVCCCNVLGRFLHHIISSFFLRFTFFASLTQSCNHETNDDESDYRLICSFCFFNVRQKCVQTYLQTKCKLILSKWN